jgi:hypothetical protein
MNDLLLEGIRAEDMPNEDLQIIAADCGISVAVALLLNFGKGITLYVPHFEPEAWDKVKIEELPNDDMQLVAEKCSMSVVRKLVENFEQAVLYVPRLENSSWARLYILKGYDGHNAKRLATTLGVSERYVYKCLKQHP